MPSKRVDGNSLFDENGNLRTSATPLMKKEAKAAKAKQEQKTKRRVTPKKGSKSKNASKSKKRKPKKSKEYGCSSPVYKENAKYCYNHNMRPEYLTRS